MAFIDSDNSTTVALSGDAVFTGSWTNVLQYSEITVLIATDQSSATSGLSMQFSTDGTNIDRAKTISVTSSGTVHTLIVISKFFRVVYTNGSTDQGEFRMQTIYHKNKSKDLTSTLSQTITDQADVQNTRSIITGAKTNGTFTNVGVNAESQLKIALETPNSAFGDLRIAEITPIIQTEFVYNINTRIWTTSTTNGTADVNASRLRLQSSANTNSHAQVNTKQYLKYRAGVGAMIRFTAVFTTGVAGSKQMIGIGDTTDGLFVGYNGATFGFLHRNNSVDTWIAQTAWNLDVCDGTNDLQNLDHTKGNVYMIQFQYLGYGAITLHVEETTTGRFIPVHRIANANTSASTNLTNPSMPLYARAENTTNDTNIILYSGSLSAYTEGKIVIPSTILNSVNNTKSSITTLTNILTIRNKTTFASITNKNNIHLSVYNATVDGNKNAIIELYLNCTLGGSPSYTDIDTDTSIVDYDTAGTTITNGTKILSEGVAKTGSITTKLVDLDIILPPGDTLTIACTSSQATECSVTVSWVEDY